jgi:hypothetical protein
MFPRGQRWGRAQPQHDETNADACAQRKCSHPANVHGCYSPFPRLSRTLRWRSGALRIRRLSFKFRQFAVMGMNAKGKAGKHIRQQCRGSGLDIGLLSPEHLAFMPRVNPRTDGHAARVFFTCRSELVAITDGVESRAFIGYAKNCRICDDPFESDHYHILPPTSGHDREDGSSAAHYTRCFAITCRGAILIRQIRPGRYCTDKSSADQALA